MVLTNNGEYSLAVIEEKAGGADSCQGRAKAEQRQSRDNEPHLSAIVTGSLRFVPSCPTLFLSSTARASYRLDNERAGVARTRVQRFGLSADGRLEVVDRRTL